MNNFASKAQRLATDIEQLMKGFSSNDPDTFNQAFGKVYEALPEVSGIIEPFGLEHANLLRKRVGLILQITSDNFSKTRRLFKDKQPKKIHVEWKLKVAAELAIASLRSWAAKCKDSPKRKSRSAEPGKLTEKQLEAYQTVSECQGNVTKAAKLLKRDRKTIEQHYKAAMDKLGKKAIKRPKTRQISRDRRGQDDISEIDDNRRNSDDCSYRNFRMGAHHRKPMNGDNE